MIKTLTTAATGLEAQQANIERISNDLANVNTDGYKRSRTEFQDLMYQTIKEPGGSTGAASKSPVGIQTGLGVKVGATHKVFEQGPARTTYHPYDLMIEGRGFFQVQLPSGEIGYTRHGSFHTDAQGRVQLSSGARIIPEITVPPNAVNVVISPEGEVKVTMPDQSQNTIGQITLVMIGNEAGLSAAGGHILKKTDASGAATPTAPGESGSGKIQQGALEGSNVNVANSMVEMITTQRAYEMGTRMMGVADKMWESTNQMK